jgi:hypothetical protein
VSTESDEGEWITITHYSKPVQEQFNTDGRWRWRPMAKSDDAEPAEWKAGRAPG